MPPIHKKSREELLEIINSPSYKTLHLLPKAYNELISRNKTTSISTGETLTKVILHEINPENIIDQARAYEYAHINLHNELSFIHTNLKAKFYTFIQKRDQLHLECILDLIKNKCPNTYKTIFKIGLLCTVTDKKEFKNKAYSLFWSHGNFKTETTLFKIKNITKQYNPIEIAAFYGNFAALKFHLNNVSNKTPNKTLSEAIFAAIKGERETKSKPVFKNGYAICCKILIENGADFINYKMNGVTAINFSTHSYYQTILYSIFNAIQYPYATQCYSELEKQYIVEFPYKINPYSPRILFSTLQPENAELISSTLENIESYTQHRQRAQA